MSVVIRYKNLRRVPRFPAIWPYIGLIDSAWSNLDALLPYSHRVKGLLLNTSVDDISAIDQFVELRELVVSEYCSGGFELTALPHLEKLGVDVGPDRQIVPGGGRNLRELNLSRATRPWATWITTLPRLESLRLDFPNSLPTRLPASLQRLELSGVRHWRERGGCLRWSGGFARVASYGCERANGLEQLRFYPEIEVPLARGLPRVAIA